MKFSWGLALGVVFLSVGCNQRAEIEASERQLEIIKKTSPSDLDAICKAYQRVARAYLEAEDQKGYELAKLGADINCRAADLKRTYG